MKTKLLKLALCAMTLLPLGAWAAIDFGSEEVVNTTTTWTFNGYSDGDMKSYSQTNKLYLRAISTRYYSISSLAESQNLQFSDNYQVTVNKVATSNAAGSMSTSDAKNYITTANSRPSGTNNGTSFFAFNASVPGTVYVLMQAVTGSSYRPRIFFYKDGDSYATSVQNPTNISHTNIHELTYTSTKAGSFFIGTTTETCKIYAIRFVPNYTISYNANGGTGSMSSNTVVSGNNQTLTANTFTKDHYTFSNWTADVDVTIGGETVPAGSAIADVATIQNVTSDIALTAQWTANTYTVTHTLTGATTSSAESATYNTDYSATYTASGGYVLPDAVTVTAGGSDITANCTWTKATGTVSIPGAYVTGDIEITVAATKLAVTSIWNFDQFMGSDSGETVVNTGGSTKGVFDFNGLYIHYNGSRTFKAKNGHGSVMSIYNSGSSDGVPTASTTAESSDADVCGFAYKTGGAGTLTVKVYVGGNNRDISIYSNGVKKIYALDGAGTADTYTYSKDTHTLTYTANGSEVIYIIPLGGAIYFDEIKFVPKTAVTMTKDVTISGAGYATFCAPQNYQWSTSNYPELKAYTVSSVDTEKATITEIAASEGHVTIPACTGVILKGDARSYVFTSTETAGEVGTNSLIANLADYVLPADNGTYYNYTLAAGPKFKHVKSTDPGILAAGKAFLRTKVNVEGGSARGLDLVFDEGETTGIREMEKLRNGENEKFYNLNGQLVAQPTRGLYIVNGKKVIIK